MVIGFVAEHSLPLTIAPELVQLSQTLADDKRALSALKLSRWTTSYKLNHGLGKYFSDETLGEVSVLFKHGREY